MRLLRNSYKRSSWQVVLAVRVRAWPLTSYQNWTAGAEEYCERVENPRQVDVVERNLESVQKALKERERRHGATVEEMTIEVNNAKAVLDNAEADLKSLAALNNVRLLAPTSCVTDIVM